MSHIIQLLQGKKTYIIAGFAGVTVFLHLAGYIDTATYEAILALLGVSGLATLRAGVTKVK